MAKWFGAYYNMEVCISSAAKFKQGPQVLTSLLNQVIIIIIVPFRRIVP